MAITISGENNNDRILAQDGVIDEISGINIVGLLTAGHINVGSNIQLGNAGIVTATTFIGNLTGNVNSTSPLLLQTGGSERFRITSDNALGIAGANYGSSGQVLTSGGSGSAVTWSAIPTQVTIANNADNRVITGGSGTNLNGEANFTWDGNKIHATATGEIARFQSTNSVSTIRLYSTASSHTEIGHTEDTYIAVGGAERFRIKGSDGSIQYQSGGGKGYDFGSSGSSASVANMFAPASYTIAFGTNNVERLRIDLNGNVNIGVNGSSNPFTYLRFGASLYGAADIRPTDEASHKVGLAFYTDGTQDTTINPTEKLRINSTGQLLHGHNASIGYGRNFETSSTSGYGGIAINRFSADTGSGGLDFVKSRNASLGGNTILQSDDNIGAITWRGADGTDFTTPAAQIKVAVDGTPGSNDMPGRIMFYTTADGASSVSERLRIDSVGKVAMNYDAGLVNAQYGNLEILKDGASNVDPNWSYLSFHRTGQIAWQQGINANDFVIASSGGAARDTLQTEKLRIESDGDVIWNGTGTVTPGYSNSTVGMGFEPRNGTIFLSRADNLLIHANRNNDGRMINFSQGGTQKFNIGLKNSGADLAFNSGTAEGTERLRISSAGYVTKPNHPGFFAYMDGGDQTTNAATVIPFNLTHFNTGGHFKTSGTNAYKFVCPVAGIYHFSGGMWLKHGSGTGNQARWQIRKNNVIQCQAGWHQNGVNLNDHSGPASITIYCNANDTVYAYADYAISYWRGGSAHPHSYFSGHLVG